MVSGHGADDVGLASGEVDECAVVLLTLGWQRFECGHEQGVLQWPVPSAVDVLRSDEAARAPDDEREAGMRGQVGGGGGMRRRRRRRTRPGTVLRS